MLDVSQKDERFIEIASRHAERSTMISKHGSVITYKGKILPPVTILTVAYFRWNYTKLRFLSCRNKCYSKCYQSSSPLKEKHPIIAKWLFMLHVVVAKMVMQIQNHV